MKSKREREIIWGSRYLYTICVVLLIFDENSESFFHFPVCCVCTAYRCKCIALLNPEWIFDDCFIWLNYLHNLLSTVFEMFVRLLMCILYPHLYIQWHSSFSFWYSREIFSYLFDSFENFPTYFIRILMCTCKSAMKRYKIIFEFWDLESSWPDCEFFHLTGHRTSFNTHCEKWMNLLNLILKIFETR